MYSGNVLRAAVLYITLKLHLRRFLSLSWRIVCAHDAVNSYVYCHLLVIAWCRMSLLFGSDVFAHGIYVKWWAHLFTTRFPVVLKFLIFLKIWTLSWNEIFRKSEIVIMFYSFDNNVMILAFVLPYFWHCFYSVLGYIIWILWLLVFLACLLTTVSP